MARLCFYVILPLCILCQIKQRKNKSNKFHWWFFRIDVSFVSRSDNILYVAKSWSRGLPDSSFYIISKSVCEVWLLHPFHATVSLYNSLTLKKGFVMFTGDKERDQCHEMCWVSHCNISCSSQKGYFESALWILRIDL